MQEEVAESGWEAMQTVDGQPLSDEEVAQLLARLPALASDEDDRVEFKRRDDSLPPPLSGDDIEGQWPPETGGEAVEMSPDGSLRVQAFRPTGEVSPPFQVALAFDRPVVDLGAVGTQESAEFALTPDVEGRWRWLGTQSVVFEPSERWPMATEFEIVVRRGLRAVDGTALDEDLRFSFATPAPELQAIYPTAERKPQAIDAAVALVFNQAIHDASRDAIAIEAQGQSVPMAPLEEPRRREVIEQWGLEEADEEGRVLVLTPQSPYPEASRVDIRVQGPLKSAEGPVVGMADRSTHFMVRGPFELTGVECGWGHRCTPRSAIRLRFSNLIDDHDENLDVVADPPVEDLAITTSTHEAVLTLTGDFQPRTDYTFTVDEAVVDIFGQPLQGERSQSITVGPHDPLLVGPKRTMLVRPLDAQYRLPLRAAELESFRVRVFDASPDDWGTFLEARSHRNRDLALQPVSTSTRQFSASERRRNQEIGVDYSAAFENGEPGHAIVVVDRATPRSHGAGTTLMYWIQHTDLAVDISSDLRDMIAEVTSIADGSPVADAVLSAGTQTLGQSDVHGRATVAVPTGPDGEEPIVVRRSADSLVIPVDGHANWFHRGMRWSALSGTTQNIVWYVVDDRQMYRPGETAKLRGWIRTLEQSPRSLPQGVSEGHTVDYTVRDPRRNELTKGQLEIDRFGGFELAFEVPEGANLGHAHIDFRVTLEETASHHHHRVQFQEFRRPEYEVNLETKAGPHIVEHSTDWTAQASYYAGGAVAGAPTTWSFSESSASFEPPGWSGWSFGQWQPWWSPWASSGDGTPTHQVLPEALRGTRIGETDAQGRDEVAMQFQTPERGFARRLTGTVSVTDVNRQSWEATDSILVHPGAVYVGLRSEKNFISRDESFELEAVAVDISGERVEGRDIEVSLMRQRGADGEAVDQCHVVSSDEPVTCAFADLRPGVYQIRASIRDAQGRLSQTETTFWVAGRDSRGAQTAEEDEFVLIPEGDEFSVGDSARLFVQAPYYPVEAVVELRRDGRFERREVTLTEDDSVIDIDIEESMIPNIHVRVSGLASGDAYAPDHFGSGSIELDIDRAPRALDVAVEPSKTSVAPGDEAQVEVTVSDANGRPVEGAQVLLFAVDESVLALSDYSLADPLLAFYPRRAASMHDLRSRSWLLLDALEDADEELPEQRPQIDMMRGERGEAASGVGSSVPAAAPRMLHEAPMEASAAFGGAAGAGDAAPAIDVREVFDALAFYRSDLVTDADGAVTVTESMPDSLTRYRLMAVSVQGEHLYGSGEQELTVRKPLMVRPSAPRFLNVGDRLEFPVIVHNQSDRSQTVDVALRSNGRLEWLQGAGRRIELGPDQRVETRFLAQATSAGTARVQVAAASDESSDAELVSFPILTPATTEAFATYGSIADGDEDALMQALRIPEDAHADFGGLEFSAASTQLQALTDAFVYLTTYQFNCSEQLASRIMSVLSLYDVLESFQATDLPDAKELRSSMNEWVDALVQMQRSDGGFGFWPGARRTSPFSSVHATLALWMAAQAGYDVEPSVLNRGVNYLEGISRHVSDYDPRAAAAVESYALHVRHRMDEDITDELQNYLGRRGIEDISLESLGWLLPLAQGTQFEARFLERITGQVQETASTAEFQETYSSDAHHILHTSRRTDGVVLDGLMHVDPDHHLIEKVGRGLLAHRRRGRWANTQENVFILKALRRYFDTYESVTPDFIARAWLGDDQIAEHGFDGRSVDRYSVEVPMRFLQDGQATRPVVVQRDGEGRMYYRLGIRYAPKSRDLPAINEGFGVERNYEAVDNPDDVRRGDEGWEIRAGARVRVELTMTIPARRYHVALVDWLPAGFEPINTALSVSHVDDGLIGGSTDPAHRWGWWGRPWFEHQNLRDERVEAFASLVSNGVHTYSYVARATTPGEFIAMPARAEEMYHPETFGRGQPEMVRIIDD